MQNIKKILIFTSIFLMLVIPVVSFAYKLGDPIVPPCSEYNVINNSSNLKQCDWRWNELLTLVNNIIGFILQGMVIPIAAIMFAYAGFLFITAGGEAAHARTKAKSIFSDAIIGLLISVAAFLIIKTLLLILGYQGSWIGF